MPHNGCRRPNTLLYLCAIPNGSPHYEKINEAFRGHGLAADNVAYAAVGWSGSPPGDPAHGQNMAVTVTAPLTAVQVLLRYRINGGSWNSIEMEEVDPGTESPSVPFQGIIPGANTTVGDVIDLYVRVEMSDTNKPFTCFPTQAQLRFPDPGYGPDDRNFFTRVVTDSAKQTALSTDFATDPGWTSDPTGKWVFGEPTFTDHGEQPGFDFPFDANTNCCFTHETESVTGTWRLDTNTFSLAGADAAVVRFALWFFVRNGTAQNDKFIVRIGDGSTFTTILTVSAQDLDESAPGAEQRIRWIRKSVTITDPNQLMSGRVLRFSAIRNSSNGTIEAAIDEVRVWRAYD